MCKKKHVAVWFWVCIISFGTLQTCFGQKGNPAPKGGEKVERVVPQDNAHNKADAQADGFPLTQEQVNYNHLTLIYARMVKREPIKDTMYLDRSLLERLGFIQKGIAIYRDKIDEIQAIGIENDDNVVKKDCETEKSSKLFKVAESLEIRMSEGVPKRRSAREQLEASLWNDPEILYIVAEIKLHCEDSVWGLGIIEENSRKAADKIKEPIDKADKVLGQIKDICTGICMQFSDHIKKYWENKLGMGKPETVFFKSVNGEQKAYVMGKAAGTDEIPKVVVPKRQP
ncbi:MAG: hypothetical protein ACOX3T_03190 [Bdellovibrionota bacterium]|jgi:hypothetical protein